LPESAELYRWNKPASGHSFKRVVVDPKESESMSQKLVDDVE